MISRGSPLEAESQSETIDKRLEWIRRTILASHHERILDLGCGKGVYDDLLCRMGTSVVGIDIERTSLMDRRPRHRSSVERIQGEAEHIPIRDKTFDAVICIEVLEHVADLDKTILEVSRVLKPKGILVVTVPNRGFPFLTHGFRLGRRNYSNLFGIPLPLATYLPLPILKRVWRARCFRAMELKEFIDQHGFVVTDIRFLSPAFETILGKVMNRDCEALLRVLRRLLTAFDLNTHFWPGLSIAAVAVRV